jgi:hypothetical protein
MRGLRLVFGPVEHSTSAAGGEGPSPADSIRRLLEEANRVSGELAVLSDSLVAQSDLAKRQSQKLIDALAEATARFEALTGEAEGESTRSAGQLPGSSDGARLLATQLMINGSSREETETQLRSEFGIEHATEMLDQVFASQRDRP